MNFVLIYILVMTSVPYMVGIIQNTVTETVEVHHNE